MAVPAICAVSHSHMLLRVCVFLSLLSLHACLKSIYADNVYEGFCNEVTQRIESLYLSCCGLKQDRHLLGLYIPERDALQIEKYVHNFSGAVNALCTSTNFKDINCLYGVFHHELIHKTIAGLKSSIG